MHFLLSQRGTALQQTLHVGQRVLDDSVVFQATHVAGLLLLKAAHSLRCSGLAASAELPLMASAHDVGRLGPQFAKRSAQSARDSGLCGRGAGLPELLLFRAVTLGLAGLGILRIRRKSGVDGVASRPGRRPRRGR
eukprot:scaffold2893_cov254-Pinguiococcus_pyrenoidosus.AAC.36